MKMNKIFLFIIFLISLINIVFAQESSKSYAPVISSVVMYILIFIAIPLIFIIFFVKKLKYNFSQFLKSLLTPLIVTIIIQGLILVLAFTIKGCAILTMFGPCITNFQYAIMSLPTTLPIIFMITTLVYYIIKVIKNR